MDFRIVLHTGEQLKFINKLPVSLTRKQFFPDILYSSGDWGAITFQRFFQEDFFVSHCTFVFNEKSTIHTTANIELLRLHIIYRNNFITKSRIGTIHFKERQFNLIYFPFIDIQTEFIAAGEYILFDITYSKEYLLRFAPYLPGLYEFLNKSETTYFRAVNLFCSPAMLKAVEDAVNHEYYNDFAKFYLESKVLEILTLAFEKLNDANGGDFKIGRIGEERAKSIRQWIDEHYDDPGSLRDLARMFGTNEFKLRTEFKALYGAPVFDFVLKAKLTNAMKLLLETDMPIAEIAYKTGYANPGHFSRAFKNEFGVTPKYMRKHK